MTLTFCKTTGNKWNAFKRVNNELKLVAILSDSDYKAYKQAIKKEKR